jgi:hypothetical protein
MRIRIVGRCTPQYTNSYRSILACKVSFPSVTERAWVVPGILWVCCRGVSKGWDEIRKTSVQRFNVFLGRLDGFESDG